MSMRLECRVTQAKKLSSLLHFPNTMTNYQKMNSREGSSWEETLLHSSNIILFSKRAERIEHSSPISQPDIKNQQQQPKWLDYKELCQNIVVQEGNQGRSW